MKSHYFWLVLVAILAGVAFAESPASQPAVDHLIVWDGDAHNTGAGFTHGGASKSFGRVETEAHAGKASLELKESGGGFMGGGWTWCDNWNRNGPQVVDLSGYTHLTFWAKLKGSPPGWENVLLFSANDKGSKGVNLLEICPDLSDGQWHEIAIPLTDLMDDKGFDPKHVWMIQFMFDDPNVANNYDYTMWFDDIGFENRPLTTQPAK